MSDIKTETSSPITNQEREDYITANEHELTQLAIQNRMEFGDGALYVELDNVTDLSKREIKVMYFTSKLLQLSKETKEILDIITSNISKECIHLIYNDENGKSVVIEKRIT
jgi:hypothetical protein